MRTTLASCMVILPLLFAACASDDTGTEMPPKPGPEAGNAAAPAPTPAPELAGVTKRRFQFTYTTTIPEPEQSGPLRVWVPLPMEDGGIQKVENLVVTPASARITTDPTHGNRMAYVEVADPSGPTVISWTARITRWQDEGQGYGPNIANYLQPNRMIPIDGEAQRLAKETGGANASLPLTERARAIYDDVLNAMDYDKVTPGWGLGDFDRSVAVCKGNCTDFHARFIGVGRASRIPVRFTMGIPMKATREGTYNSYHCWAHYRDGNFWKPVDISEADKAIAKGTGTADDFFGSLDPHRLSLSVGRDITLEPAQAGEPLQYFVFPYAEAGGEAMPLGKKDWVFTWKELP